MLGHRAWAVGRYADHTDAVLLGGFQVDAVEAGAAQGNQLDASLGQGSDGLRTCLRESA